MVRGGRDRSGTKGRVCELGKDQRLVSLRGKESQPLAEVVQLSRFTRDRIEVADLAETTD